MKFISKLAALLVFGVLSFLAGSPLGAVFGPENVGLYLAVIFGIVALFVFTAPTGRRAWGRGSLLTGALFLALPITTMLLSGQAFNEVVATSAPGNEDAARIGAGIGAGMMVGVAGFFGFFLGAIFLVAGLVLTLGGRGEVVIVESKR